MKSSELATERNILAVRADGAAFEVRLVIGKPYKIAEDEWACSVGLDGLYNDLRDQHAMDSWHALQLAYQLVVQLLGYFVEDGGRLYWAENGGEFFISDLVPKPRAF